MGVFGRLLGKQDKSRLDDLTSGPKPESLALYHYDSCPFCVRVRRVLSKLGVECELRNTQLDPARRQELIEGGGRSQVPCLLIQDASGSKTWLYESSDIVSYLTAHYG